MAYGYYHNGISSTITVNNLTVGLSPTYVVYYPFSYTDM